MHAAAILFLNEPAVLEHAEESIVRDEDGRSRLDRGRFAELEPQAAEKLEKFMEESRRVLRAHRNGEGGVPFSILEVELYQDQQRDDKAGRRDLLEVLNSGFDTPHLGEILQEATGSSPDWSVVEKLSSSWAGTILRDGTRTSLVMKVPNARGWSIFWGGAPAENEVRRRVEIEFNHAAWRDRRVRRLVAVRVVADEIWSDPEMSITSEASS